MSSDKTLITVATIAFVLALASAIVSLSGGFSLTGNQVSDQGNATLTVNENLQVNFTTDSVNWQTGYVYSNATSATLDTEGNVTNGTWSSVSQPLVLENKGNVNASINLSSGTDAAGFIGGGDASDAPNPVYNWSISESESNTCVGSLSNNNGYHNVNSSGEIICNNMSFGNNNDELAIDIRLVVPYDSDRTTKTDTLTAVATSVTP